LRRGGYRSPAAVLDHFEDVGGLIVKLRAEKEVGRRG
jgi:hypothetical protein